MQQQLEINLANDIRKAYQESISLAEHAKGFASQAVAKAIECGRLLLRQKEALGHGSWLDWLEFNLPEIHHNTAGRYMRLVKLMQLPENQAANSSHVMNLDAPTIRQAYIATGILPSPVKPDDEPPDPNKPWVRYTRFLDGFRLWYNTRIAEDPIETWDVDPIRILAKELTWFANLHAELHALVSKKSKANKEK